MRRLVVSLIVTVLFILHGSAGTRKRNVFYEEVCHVSKTCSPYFLPVIMHMDAYIKTKRDGLVTFYNNLCVDVFTIGRTSETVMDLRYETILLHSEHIMLIYTLYHTISYYVIYRKYLMTTDFTGIAFLRNCSNCRPKKMIEQNIKSIKTYC